MFFAAVACAVTAALSLFYSNLAIAISVLIIAILAFLIFKGGVKYITVAVCFLAFITSLFSECRKLDKINSLDGTEITAKFTVVSEPQEYEKFNSLTVKIADNTKLPQNTKYLLFDHSKTDVSGGDMFFATIKIKAIAQDDEYRLYDYGNSIYATASVTDLKLCDETNTFYKFSENIRAYIKNTVSYMSGGDSVGLLIALTSGDKSQISDNFLENVRTTGISHVIVVSGMHLSIIMTAIFYVVDRLFYNKYIRGLLSVVAVLIISGICGFTMSIVRAGAMFIIAGLAPVFNRENDSLSSLCTAVSVVLITAPFAIFNFSFQLSVLSTVAIIWVVPFYSQLVEEKFHISSKIIKAILNIVFCSVFAMIFTLPVVIKKFGFVSVISPFTNLLVTYPITISLVLNIIALLLSLMPVINVLGRVVFFVTDMCAKFVVFIVNKIAQLPITVAILPDSAFVFSILLIAAIIAIMYIYDFRLKKKRSDFCARSI